jgi:hypothetical protein
MNVTVNPSEVAEPREAEAILKDVAAHLASGEVAPYLGPGVAALSSTSVPTSAEALAAFFASKVALPKRAKGNVWASAQHIESTRHRATVTAMMAEAFAAPVEPTALHVKLAALAPPLIVDSWYDGAMRAAMTRADWGEAQGITRAGIGEDRWFRFYDAKGVEASRDVAEGWRTLLYKPHGGITPAKNFLITDADYVEALTEIDIQTPIPEAVKWRRAGRGFLFLGCRFDDQLLRIYARQISKRSSDTHYAVVDPATLKRNEIRFLDERGVVPLALPLVRAAEIIVAA